MALLCALGPATAHAQPSAVVVEAVVQGEADALAASMQRVVRARIDALDVAQLEATPALGLRDLGLAVGCVGATPPCLAQIAEQLDVRVLLWLEIERSGSALSVSLVRYDAGRADTRQVDRRFRGGDADAEALDAADALVREMFDLPPPAPEPEVSLERATSGQDPALEIGLPVTLLGVGALTLAAGLVVGAVSESTRDEYMSLTVTSATDVDRALSLHDRASVEATAANALYVAGGVLMAGGLVALILSAATGGDDEPEALSAGPLVGPSTLGLQARGHFGGAR